ncbi:MAG: SGNH/GDSL hydrolase family protein [Melioribacteraceae bacterium]|nr:SGNH/GDSL hydrolase family protein [Melioribacteraceae bacterium]
MKKKFLLLLSTLLIFFILTEITFNILVKQDLDGNMSFNHVQLKPYKLPIKETKKKIDNLIDRKVPDSLLQYYAESKLKRSYFNVRLIPDSILGWSPSPIYNGNNGFYIYNEDAIRSNDILADYSQKKGLRIAIFGDSYLHGDEVKFQNTVGNYLELLLSKNNIDAEVLNFAVSGYGIDQSLLRWELIKEKFQPDIVILGVQFENVKRHINLVRPFYYYTTAIPYSKPRFVISGNKLQLIKNPIPDINKTVDIIEHFDDWDFSNFEGFYNKENYIPNPLYLSKSISFFSSAISQILAEIYYYNSSSESYQVTYKIIEKFSKNVESENGIFIPLHLPVLNDFDFITQSFLDIFYNQKFIYDDLFSTLKLQYSFVEPYTSLNEWGETNGFERLFMTRHYSPIANKIIAGRILEHLQSEYSGIINKHRIE